MVLCCQVSCAGGEGVHSAMLLKMTLDFISFTCLHISWISLQIFKLPVMGWAAVPFMQGAGGASFFCQKREEDKLPVVPAPAQGWHLSPLWTPQILVLWVFQLFHGGNAMCGNRERVPQAPFCGVSSCTAVGGRRGVHIAPKSCFKQHRI